MTTYLTPEQATKRLPFGTADWIRQQLRSGKLRGSKVAGRWVVEESAIDEMVANGANATARRRRRRAA